MHDDETIAFVPAQVLEALEPGFTADDERVWWERLERALAWAPRAPLEGDPTRKQLIPYVLVRRGPTLFGTRRLSGGREARLHDRIAFGMGGHVARTRSSEAEPIMASALRELEEELELDAPSETIRTELTYRGLIYDPSNEVGRVHLGLLFEWRLGEDRDVRVREVEKLAGSWWSPAEIREKWELLESWSQIALSSVGLKNA